jgi:hypothetical protein
VDLRLYFRVLWRYRPLMIYGTCVALLLALLSGARITTHGIKARGTTTWSSTATLLITHANDFPYGRTAPAYLPANPSKGIPSIQVADPNQLTSLSLLYAQLANSDAVRALMRQEGPIRGSVAARPVFQSANNNASNASSYLLPLITLTATSTQSGWAVQTAQLGTRAFLDYISQQQNDAKIPGDQRVSVQVLQSASSASIVSAPGVTLPVVVFIAIIIAVIALAFVLENLRQRPTAQPKTRRRSQAPVHEQPIKATKADVHRA